MKEPKPRIFLLPRFLYGAGAWGCGLVVTFAPDGERRLWGALGTGSTPREAFRDWQGRI